MTQISTQPMCLKEAAMNSDGIVEELATAPAWLSNDRIMEQWEHIPDRLQRRWRKLTNEDVRRAGGSAEYLAERLQHRYGVDRREAFLQLSEFESEL
jgi:uncharacterized protein YjbJ (UPF0337 family)